MANRPFVVDTSALLTLIEAEIGVERVEEVLRKEAILLPWPALTEVYYISQQESGRSEADRRFALLKQLPGRILWEADEAVALTAARFKAEYRVSFADAMIAAFASRNEATLLHKDPEFEVLADLVQLESLPYKNHSLGR